LVLPGRKLSPGQMRAQIVEGISESPVRPTRLRGSTAVFLPPNS
jgi:hypothetical protein